MAIKNQDAKHSNREQKGHVYNVSRSHCSKRIIKITFSFQDLLEQLFKLFDQERVQSLPQENWIEFLKERLM